ncbi:Tyrosine-protein phosphatase non-receptor type 23 [Holothuria leucospilota]|uniref:Tyrosine-protein phosphatase non-receptor type 23 n=1 Tax=Holothuria leucospilota TaxID=206669 RepID=A0A9Q0YG84_HOLLE|nr:Tyrosine-protein phosphatase non-receptor type 23 [Holothuria leucospilota]
MLVPLMKDEGSSKDSYEIVKMLHKVRADIEEKNADLEKNPLTHIEVELIELKEELELPECFPPKLLKALLTISKAKEPIQLLVKCMKDLSNVFIDVDVAINEMDDILKGKDTTEMQKNFGPASVEIYQTFKSVLQKWKYSHYKLNNESNELRNCIDVYLEDIKLLAGPLEDIRAALPSLRAVEASVYKAQTNLIIKLKKLDEMKKQRKYLEEHLRERLWKDDASYTVDTQQSMKIQAFFQEELEKYTPLQTDIFLNLHAQDDILQALSDAYDVWKESRKVMADTIQKYVGPMYAIPAAHRVIATLNVKINCIQVMAEGLSLNLSCSICFDEYKTPKMLPCGHSFCRRCVSRICTEMGPSYRQCPKCRKKITLPASRKVDDFPTNFDLVDAISSQTLKHTRTKKNSCDKQQNIDPACECPKHTKRQMEFYCKSCQKQVCDNCLKNDHKPDRHRIVTASDIAGNLLRELQKLKDELKHHQEEEKSLGEQIKKGFNCYQQDKKRLEEEIRTTLQIEQEKLKKAAEDLLKELNTKVEEPDATYADLQKKYTDLQALSRQSNERLNNLDQHFKKLHVSYSTEIPKICKSIERLKDELESLKITCQWTQTSVGFNFIPNRPTTCKLGKLTKVLGLKPTILQPTNQLAYLKVLLTRSLSKTTL